MHILCLAIFLFYLLHYIGSLKWREQNNKNNTNNNQIICLSSDLN